MTAALQAWSDARENVLRRALDSLRAERRLADDNGSVLASAAADDALCVAARDLARAADDLPRERKPKGWDQ